MDGEVTSTCDGPPARPAAQAAARPVDGGATSACNGSPALPADRMETLPVDGGATSVRNGPPALSAAQVGTRPVDGGAISSCDDPPAQSVARSESNSSEGRCWADPAGSELVQVDSVAQERAAGRPSMRFDPDAYYRSNLEVLRGTPWEPGTKIHYRAPRGGPRRPTEKGFPIWIPSGESPLRQALDAADAIQASAFYVAADQWGGSNVVKEFGAYESPELFLDFVDRSPVRCFYEVIREGRPCKAYLDLEGEKGALTREEGERLLQRTLERWEELIEARWPQCYQQCPKAREALILDGSRPAGKDWKVSFHVIFPWLVFPRNDTTLKEVARQLSESPQLQYMTQDNGEKPFPDSLVYSRHRLIRMAMSWKLNDRTCTPLRLRHVQTKDDILRSFITRIEEGSWRVPPEETLGERSMKRARPLRGERTREEEQQGQVTAEQEATERAAIRKLLVDGGHGEGKLTRNGERTYRWDSDGARPCIYAQIWRPTQPSHDSNGAWIRIGRDGKASLYCLHEECRRRGAGDGEYLGQVPVAAEPKTAEREVADSEEGVAAPPNQAVSVATGPPAPSVPASRRRRGRVHAASQQDAPAEARELQIGRAHV